MKDYYLLFNIISRLLGSIGLQERVSNESEVNEQQDNREYLVNPSQFDLVEEIVGIEAALRDIGEQLSHIVLHRWGLKSVDSSLLRTLEICIKGNTS